MLKKIFSLLAIIVLPVLSGTQEFSLDVYSEKAEAISQDVMKEINWSTLRTREELLLEYIGNRDKTAPLRLFYCTKELLQKREEAVPEIMRILVATENEDKFAGVLLPFIYTKDRRAVEPLKNIIEDKAKSIKIRGLSAVLLATFVKSETYAKEKWKIAKQIIFTSESYRLEKEQEKELIKYVDSLKFREDIGVDMFLWINPGIFNFVQPAEHQETLKEQYKKERKNIILRDLKSEKKEKRETALYLMLNLPFVGRDKILEEIFNTDTDIGVRNSAKLYLKLIERIRQEKRIPEGKPAPKKK